MKIEELIQSLKNPNKFFLWIILVQSAVTCPFIYGSVNDKTISDTIEIPKMQMTMKEGKEVELSNFWKEEATINVPLGNLEDSFLFYYYEPRPDSSRSDKEIVIQEKKKGKTAILNLKKSVYLKMDETDSYRLAPKRSKCVLKCLSLTPAQAQLQLTLGEYKKFFTISLVAKKIDSSMAQQWLHDFIFLGQDKSLKCLKNSSWASVSLKGKKQLIQRNALLYWDRGGWSLVSNNCDAQNLPLLKIINITPNTLTIKIWDSEKSHATILHTISNKNVSPNGNKPETIINSGVYRTLHYASVKIKQQRLVVRPKSWFAFSHGRWLSVKEDYLAKNLKKVNAVGEVIFFDEILSKGNKKFLKGKVFDNSHLYVQDFEVPLQPVSSQHRNINQNKKSVFFIKNSFFGAGV